MATETENGSDEEEGEADIASAVEKETPLRERAVGAQTAKAIGRVSAAFHSGHRQKSSISGECYDKPDMRQHWRDNKASFSKNGVAFIVQ